MIAAAPRPIASCRSARAERRPAGQHAHDRAGDEQREPDEHARHDQRRRLGEPERERQHRHGRPAGEEREARQPRGQVRARPRRGPRTRASSYERVLVSPAPGPRRRSRLVRRHPSGAVDQRELVGVDVEVGDHASCAPARGRGVSSSRWERTEIHSPAPIDSAPASSPASPVSRMVLRRHPAAADAQDEGEVAHQPVVGPEDRRPEGPGHAGAAARGEPAHDLFVDRARRRPWPGWRRGRRRKASGSPPAATSASTNTDPKRRASAPSVLVRRLPRTGRPMSSPSTRSQCAACRSSASAMASRISRSSPRGGPASRAVERCLLPLVGEPAAPPSQGGRARVLGPRCHPTRLSDRDPPSPIGGQAPSGAFSRGRDRSTSDVARLPTGRRQHDLAVTHDSKFRGSLSLAVLPTHAPAPSHHRQST